MVIAIIKKLYSVYTAVTKKYDSHQNKKLGLGMPPK
jgi:hypothetical protein